MEEKKYITIKINWATDDGESPPQLIQDKVTRKINLWLHEQGLEGSLTEEGGIAALKILKPEDWIVTDIQEFSRKLTNNLAGFYE